MKNEDAMKLKPKEKVIHRRYGVCFVKEVVMSHEGLLFGVVVSPANKNGQELLMKDCGCDVPDLLEDRARSLSLEKDPVKPGDKSIDHLTAWGTPQEDMPVPELKNHFAPNDEEVPG